MKQVARGTARRIVKPGQFFNRIHVADIAQAVDAAFAKSANGIFNITDDLDSMRRSLERWEPRITLDGVDVSFDREDMAVVYIDVRYRINDTNDTRNLVFPFYTIPAES